MLPAVIKIGILIYCVSSFLPILKSDEWWIRVLDFPRLQLLVLGFGLGLAYLFMSSELLLSKIILLSILALGMGFDLYRILPYTPVWRVESHSAEATSELSSVDLMIANVLQDNKESQKLLRLISIESPDVILLLEVNQRWLNALRDLDADYKFQLKKPLDNLYGIALFSRLPLEDVEIRYLVEDGIPSVYAKLQLSSGDRVELYGVHPEPPRPDSGTTTERDAELVVVPKKS